MINNFTRHKAEEAKFHLLQAKERYQEDDVFSYFLSAFLSAARSITFYMKKQYGKQKGFAEWYCVEQTKMIADKDLEYLNDARVEDVHRRSVSTGRTRAVTCSTDVIVVKEGEEELIETMPIEAEETVKDKSVTLNRYFAERESVEIIEFCSCQLSKLTALVARCEEWYHSKTN